MRIGRSAARPIIAWGMTDTHPLSSIITAAIARIPGLIGVGPLVAFSLSLVFVAVGIAYDRYFRRRIHPVYLWGGALIFASVPGRLALSSTDGWRALAEVLTR
jgi:hypothetical protein